MHSSDFSFVADFLSRQKTINPFDKRKMIANIINTEPHERFALSFQVYETRTSLSMFVRPEINTLRPCLPLRNKRLFRPVLLE